MDPQILQQIKLLISETILISIDEIQDNSSLGEDLDMDSLDLVDVVIGLEQLFHIHIDEENLNSMIALEDIYNVVKAHLGNK